MSPLPRPWRSKPSVVVLISALLVLLAGCRCQDAPPSKPDPLVQARAVTTAAPIPQIDVHVHLSEAAGERLTALMDRYHVRTVFNLSGGSADHGLPAQIAQASRYPGRIIVFAQLAYHHARYPDYGERMAEDLRRAHAAGARGLKIAKLLGLGLRGPDGQLLPVDDPQLDVVFEAAADLAMPVAIHTGDPMAFWDPVTPANERFAELRAHPGWSLYGHAVPSFDELYAQLERRIARHPRTTFISVHFGNCAEQPERVAESLRRFPNLYIDTAARIPELGRHDPQMMRAFFEEFQDRILYGSDLGVGPEPSPLFLGSSGPTPPGPADVEHFFVSSRRYFETEARQFAHPTPIQGDWLIDGLGLSESILRKVYFENAQRLIDAIGE